MSSTQLENPYKPFLGDSEDNPRLRQALQDYEDTLRQIAEGTFPVKKGSKVFRVINGLKVGRSSTGLIAGEVATKNYATPHASAIEQILSANDLDQFYYDGSPHDPYQRVAVITVEEFEVPKPDITHQSAQDRDQVIVTGTVEEILKPEEFFSKYRKEVHPSQQ